MSITIWKRASVQSMRPSRKQRNKTRPSTGWMWKTLWGNNPTNRLENTGFKLLHRTLRKVWVSDWHNGYETPYQRTRDENSHQERRTEIWVGGHWHLQQVGKRRHYERKSGPITLSAMKESFNKMGFPMSVYSDNDRAFQAGVKDFFEKEGITHVVTLTHANVVERFIRIMKNMIHDRVRFNRGSWTVMLSKALDKYNDTVHSSTKMKPKDAHDDKNHMDVRVNLTRREKNTRKYPEVKVNDMVKVFEKKKDNYTERKEYNSKWSNQSYKIVKIEYDDVGNRTFKLEGLNKPYLRHEILKV